MSYIEQTQFGDGIPLSDARMTGVIPKPRSVNSTKETSAVPQNTRFRHPSFMRVSIRIGIITLACAFLSVAGVRADTYDYTGPVLTYGTAFLGDHITATLVTSTSIADLTTLTDITPDITSLTFNLVDGASLVSSETYPPATTFDDEVTTDAAGDILSWIFDIQSDTGAATTENSGGLWYDEWGIPETNDFGTTEAGSPPGVWVDVSLAPEPGSASQLLLGLVGLTLFIGVRRYRSKRLSTQA
jgi:hypothetical protein